MYIVVPQTVYSHIQNLTHTNIHTHQTFHWVHVYTCTGAHWVWTRRTCANSVLCVRWKLVMRPMQLWKIGMATCIKVISNCTWTTITVYTHTQDRLGIPRFMCASREPVTLQMRPNTAFHYTLFHVHVHTYIPPVEMVFPCNAHHLPTSIRM